MAEAPNHRFWDGRPVFLTGHTGFKGAWLTAWLTRLGARVHGYSSAPVTEPSLFALATSTLGASAIGDIRDRDDIAAAMAAARPEIVFHLAAQSLVRRSYADPVETYATNVMGTVNVLEAVRRTPSVRAVVVVTTDKCYANEETGVPFRETDPLGGHDPYSSSKACCELVTAAYRASFFRGGGGAVASARAGNVIGGGDWSADRLIPDMIRARTSRHTLEIRAPDAVRPWQHVLEPLHGYLLLAERLAAHPERDAFAQAWNFGPDQDGCLSVGQVVERLAPALQVAWKVTADPQPPEARLLRLDSTRAKHSLGWSPRLHPDQALQWTAGWYLDVENGADPLDAMERQIAAYERLGEP